MRPLEPAALEEIRAAQGRIAGIAMRTPLIELPAEDAPAEIYLKLENLQPIGSFKLRGAGNVVGKIDPAKLAEGIYTASAGNWAQGLAWCARREGIPCQVVVPDTAPHTKREAIARLGAEEIVIPFEEWWAVIRDHTYPGAAGRFIHPVSDPDVIAGNGTIGLEILEDLPDVDTVVVPFGGGGLSAGIASALRALRPQARVLACEVETAAPLAASLAAGSPQVIDRRPSFVDGIGGGSVLEEMWPLARDLLAGSVTLTLSEIAAAIRLLAERAHVIAEGAGAASVAAAISGRAGGGKIVCVISGGNIDAPILAQILGGTDPDSPRRNSA
jgi:threonine dehydratase